MVLAEEELSFRRGPVVAHVAIAVNDCRGCAPTISRFETDVSERLFFVR